MTEIRSTVILGSGCAGLTAAIYAGRAGLEPLVLEGHEPGGQLTMTTQVENFPGWPEGVQGPDLIDNMKKQAARFGASFQLAHLKAVDLNANPFRLETSAGEIPARTLIVASGASARWLGLPSEQALIGHGVSSLRHLRRLLFPARRLPWWAAGFGDGRGALPYPLCFQKSRCSIAVGLSRLEDYAGARPGASQHRAARQRRDRGGAGR